jgi:hypothetical protein
MDREHKTPVAVGLTFFVVYLVSEQRLELRRKGPSQIYVGHLGHAIVTSSYTVRAGDELQSSCLRQVDPAECRAL